MLQMTVAHYMKRYARFIAPSLNHVVLTYSENKLRHDLSAAGRITSIKLYLYT